MKKLIALAVLMLIPPTAWAAGPLKLGFRAYSSASLIDCGVFGSDSELKREYYSNTLIQGFSPNDTYSRTLTLGTKGMANYSTNIGGKNRAAVHFTCRVTGTSTATPVKLFLNGVETHFLTLDSGVLVIGK